MSSSLLVDDVDVDDDDDEDEADDDGDAAADTGRYIEEGANGISSSSLVVDANDKIVLYRRRIIGDVWCIIIDGDDDDDDDDGIGSCGNCNCNT